MNKSSNEVENLLSTAYPLTFGCYHSVDEVRTVSTSYIDTFEDVHSVTYNIVHKLGPLYDAVYYTILWHNKSDEVDSRSHYYFRLGLYYGTIIKLLLWTPHEIAPIDPLDVNGDGILDRNQDENT